MAGDELLLHPAFGLLAQLGADFAAASGKLQLVGTLGLAAPRTSDALPAGVLRAAAP